VSVRVANPDDVPALVGLWTALQELSPRRRGGVPAAREVLSERYAAAVADPTMRFVVATDEPGEIVGMALLAPGATTPLDDPVLSVTHLCVADGWQHRGVGKALIAAAAGYADEAGIDQVVVSVHPQSRDVNRFFARLGFSPYVVRRTAPVVALRRRLALDLPARDESRAAVLRRELRLPRRPAALRAAARRRVASASVRPDR
jgi:GNAT superfamily N-acetyltransferase